MLSRRTLLTGAAALAAGSALLRSHAHAEDHAHAGDHATGSALHEGWLATGQVEGGFAPLALGGDLAAADLALSATRLHAIEPAVRGPLAIAVGRRPGRIALVLDRQAGRQVGRFAPAPGRVFSGHGRFTPDGAGFLTVEIDTATDRGIVALRDIAGGFTITAEWPSQGSGPHDMLHMGDSLIVANGGVEPGTPEAAGCEEAGASVAILGPDGQPRTVLTAGGDLASLSLRHLARDGHGAVVAAQEVSLVPSTRPLVYGVGAKDLVPFEAPEGDLLAMRGYVGSVAIDAGGTLVAAATPRGGRVAVWQRDGRYLGAVSFPDGCGLAATAEAGRFVATSGYGEVVRIAVEDRKVAIIARHAGGPKFDNHVSRIA